MFYDVVMLIPLRIVSAPIWVFLVAIAIGLAIRMYAKSRDKGR